MSSWFSSDELDLVLTPGVRLVLERCVVFVRSESDAYLRSK